jgi:hypothetical protein
MIATSDTPQNPDWKPRARSQASKAKGGDIEQKDSQGFNLFFQLCEIVFENFSTNVKIILFLLNLVFN